MNYRDCYIGIVRDFHRIKADLIDRNLYETAAEEFDFSLGQHQFGMFTLEIHNKIIFGETFVATAELLRDRLYEGNQRSINLLSRILEVTIAQAGLRERSK